MQIYPVPKRKRIRNEAYLRRVRELPCCHCEATQGVHAHHRTGAGVARKADDRDTMPLCDWCHRSFHDARGAFRSWDRELRAAWQAAMVAWTQRRLASEGVF